MKHNSFFPEINGNFGFGCLRLPMREEQVDYEEFCRMADAFLDAGFNYFDTAHGYIDGLSETAFRDCVARRHDRSRFVLTDKLTDTYFSRQEDIRPLFEKQLACCGVDYFDFYFMHGQDMTVYDQFIRCEAYETCCALKEEGLIRHFGISFHDKAEVLDRILTEHPEIEVVQIQFNYVDYEDASVESRKVYEVCCAHGKPVIVMEPVKGGSLVNLPREADAVFRSLNGGSNASYALRFAAGFPNMAMILSGMGSMEQMEENIKTMKDFVPLDEREMEAIHRVCGIFKSLNMIPCTACRYCIEQNKCPKGIRIPDLFAALNAHRAFSKGNAAYYYERIITGRGHGKASECIRCGKCEKVCPQHLKIREYLEEVAGVFETEH